MRQILILLGLAAFLSIPAFSQPSIGDPDPDHVPEKKYEADKHAYDDRSSTDEDEAKPAEVKKVKAGDYKTMINNLVEEVNSNVQKHCHKKNPRIEGLDGLRVYLQQKESDSAIDDAVNVNTKNRECKIKSTDCVFHGETLQHFYDLLADEKALEKHLNKKWDEKKALQTVLYFKGLEKAFKKAK